MNEKVNISYYTAKKMLMELLANDYLLKDEEVKKLLKKMASKNDEKNGCLPQSTPIIIDTQCRLFFPMYSDKEVKMSYLPKTVYIFFLLHHSGVEFKNLDNYLKELYQIYQIVSEEKNIEAGKIKKSLNNLVEPGNNRIYEICSVVRKTLSEILPAELVTQYAITGKWGGLHRIKAKRSLLEIRHEKLKQITFE
ncbi:hypothetical protein QUW47_02920 [Phocaeicola barnesiae]|uniref:hypothetical protein n=1 Tax=Phocaeicola barnesiae TaxID=376804 RepID=UPI001F25BED6|nr:hypothetical protein [Phocaeicola barnesiae]MCF2597938.1 hypothetical protein [Phocaeicola barnesiae]MDM8240857.1 hypothetical protein [Phocaeicola barnesiae]